MPVVHTATSGTTTMAFLGKKTLADFTTGSKRQSEAYFITWSVQNVTGQLLLMTLSEVGQHLFEANINGSSFLRAQDEFKI